MIFDKLKNLGAREKVGLGLAILCLLGVVTDRLVVQRIVDRFRDLDAETEKLRESLAYNKGVVSARENVAAEYQKIADVLERSPSTSEAIDAMNEEVVDLARRTGVECESLGPEEPGKQDYYEEYYVRIGKFQSEMKNLLKFLYQVQTSPGMLRVENLTITPNKEQNLVEGSMLITKVMVRGDSASLGTSEN